MTQQRHDDIVIQRRFRTDVSTHAVTQIYAVVFPGHDDRGTEREHYEEAEQTALEMAKQKKLSVWYEESPAGGGRTLVTTFRDE